MKDEKVPDFILPQLAILSDVTPMGDDWVHEIKFDGYRTMARIINGKVVMLSRRGLDWSEKYKTIAKELAKLNVKNAILDGEIVAIDKDKRSNFLTLQQALKAQDSSALQYYVFDLLFLNDEDFTSQPLLKRKEKLKEIFEQKKLHNIFYSQHFSLHGEKFFKKLCHLNFEGVISKLARKPYFQGRNKFWLKSKCHKRQEFVIGGFVPHLKGQAGIGSLVIGYYDDEDRLICAGRVGTGFSHEDSLDLQQKLEKIKQDKSPFFEICKLQKKDVIFVKPKLVCEVEFSQWTANGALRHPSFQGLRIDKLPKQIHKEVAHHLA